MDGRVKLRAEYGAADGFAREAAEDEVLREARELRHPEKTKADTRRRAVERSRGA